MIGLGIYVRTIVIRRLIRPSGNSAKIVIRPNDIRLGFYIWFNSENKTHVLNINSLFHNHESD